METTPSSDLPFEPRLWDGYYEKIFYWVHVNGTRVKCWPNAGFMNSTDGSGRRWKPEDGVLVSVCDDDLFRSEFMSELKQEERDRLAALPLPAVVTPVTAFEHRQELVRKPKRARYPKKKGKTR